MHRPTIVVVLTVNGLLFPFKDPRDNTAYMNEYFTWNGDPEGWLELCQKLQGYAKGKGFTLDFYVVTVEKFLDPRNALVAEMLKGVVNCVVDTDSHHFYYAQCFPQKVSAPEEKPVFAPKIYSCAYTYQHVKDRRPSDFPKEIRVPRPGFMPRYYVVSLEFGEVAGTILVLKELREKYKKRCAIYLVSYDENVCKLAHNDGFGTSQITDRYDVKDVNEPAYSGCILTGMLETRFREQIDRLALRYPLSEADDMSTSVSNGFLLN